jgi:putative aldouronate transport system substrate-binding protein
MRSALLLEASSRFWKTRSSGSRSRTLPDRFVTSPRGRKPSHSRREFINAAVAGAAVALVGGCRTRKRSAGASATAEQVRDVLPVRQPLVLIEPDVPSEGEIPAGFLRYPSRLVRVITEKPGRSSEPIRSMSPAWGPTPPGRGRNSFLDAVNAELGVPVAPSVQDGNTFAAKLSAVLGARDVPDLLSAPSWEIAKIPRFSQAVSALFADLTEHLRGASVLAYPMLATLPTAAWQHSVWSGRLAAVPYPTDGPFPWALFYRKDLCDRAGIEAPKSIDELYRFGVRMTDPSRGVWAFGNVFQMLQMIFKCPGSGGGWRRKLGGGLEHKFELPEFGQALEFTARLYREGLVHPDIVASSGSDQKQLFNAGKLIACQDGLGMWRGTQSEQQRITPGFNVQPVPLFSAVGGDPLAWVGQEPIFYTFVKKGLGHERTRELLRVLDWCAAPFGSVEHELNQYGVEGQHFTRSSDGSPLATELGRRELADQFRLLGGRVPSLVGTADVPHFVSDLLGYSRATYAYREPNPFSGIKLELPATFSRGIVSTEDKLNDIVRGHRPLADLTRIVDEWRLAGGDDARAFLEKVLSDNGR